MDISTSHSSLFVHPKFRVKEILTGDVAGIPITRDTTLQKLLRIAAAVEAALCDVCDALIGVAIEKSYLFVATVIGILNSRNAFLALDINAGYALKQCSRFHVSRILGRRCRLEELTVFPRSETFSSVSFEQICDEDLVMGALSSLPPQPMRWKYQTGEVAKILYAIQTSGTTGEPKTVHVPASCIMPNIVDFIGRFSLSHESRILFSTNLSFDPSMVELFLAIHAGCELVIVDNSTNNFIGMLEQSIIEVQPDFVEFTPALLQCFSRSFLTSILGPSSPLRCILIGGEGFPLNLVRSYWHPHCPAKIFNVYGVTEVSCWASCYALTKEDIERGGNRRIPIGEGLAETKLDVDPTSGLITLRGPRGCIVNFSGPHFNFTTEDRGVVEIDLHTGRTRIYVQEERQKPNSVRPSREFKAVVLDTYPEVVFCHLLFMKGCTFAFLRHCDGCTALPLGALQRLVPRQMAPTRCFWNPECHFLTSSGKIDECAMSHYVEQHFEGLRAQGTLQFLRDTYGLDVNEQSLSSTLRSLGLGSLELAEIGLFLDCGETATTPTALALYREGITLAELLDMANGAREKTSARISSYQCAKGAVRIARSRFLTIQRWETDLAGCIDAQPIFHNNLIYVGSHAGVFRCYTEDGKMCAEFVCPGRRFECPCTVHTKYIAIGSYSRREANENSADSKELEKKGEMFILDRQSLSLLERIPCAGEIEASPSIDDNGTIYWASHGGFLHIKSMRTGELISMCIASETPTGVRSTPLLLDGENPFVLMATLAGELIAWCTSGRRVKWRRHLAGPVFASLASLQTDSTTSYRCRVAVATASGLITVHDAHTGDELGSISVNEPIFDAPSVVEIDGLRRHLLYGTAAGTILLISWDGSVLLTLLRSIVPDSKLVRSPQVIDSQYVFALTTQGMLLRFPLHTLVQAAHQTHGLKVDEVISLQAETYGRPLIIRSQAQKAHGDTSDRISFRAIIGSRDNKLRYFECTLLEQQ